MAAIKGKNTKPEIAVRKALHAAGFRFRLHDRKLPGKPDMTLKRHRTVILVNGCFWHGHNCEDFRWPKSRKKFWRSKITGNQRRDADINAKLLAAGWRILTVWECALKGNRVVKATLVVARFSKWLATGRKSIEIRGNHVR